MVNSTAIKQHTIYSNKPKQFWIEKQYKKPNNNSLNCPNRNNIKEYIKTYHVRVIFKQKLILITKLFNIFKNFVNKI